MEFCIKVDNIEQNKAKHEKGESTTRHKKRNNNSNKVKVIWCACDKCITEK